MFRYDNYYDEADAPARPRAVIGHYPAGRDRKPCEEVCSSVLSPRKNIRFATAWRLVHDRSERATLIDRSGDYHEDRTGISRRDLSRVRPCALDSA